MPPLGASREALTSSASAAALWMVLLARVLHFGAFFEFRQLWRAISKEPIRVRLQDPVGWTEGDELCKCAKVAVNKKFIKIFKFFINSAFWAQSIPGNHWEPFGGAPGSLRPLV